MHIIKYWSCRLKRCQINYDLRNCSLKAEQDLYFIFTPVYLYMCASSFYINVTTFSSCLICVSSLMETLGLTVPLWLSQKSKHQVDRLNCQHIYRLKDQNMAPRWWELLARFLRRIEDDKLSFTTIQWIRTRHIEVWMIRQVLIEFS